MNTQLIRRVVVVLGMHRSGTSALTGGLKTLGVQLGDNVSYEPAFDNLKGFWEDQDVLKINEDILKVCGLAWHSLANIDQSFWETSTAATFKLEAIKLVRSRIYNYPIWGFKEPRTCRLLPFWKDVFQHSNVQDNYIIVLRNPKSVADSLAVRNHFKPEKSYLLWLNHIVSAIHELEGKSRIVLDYDRLIKDPIGQLNRISGFLDLPIITDQNNNILETYIKDFLDNSLRHAHWYKEDIEIDPRINTFTRQVYKLLDMVSQDQLSLDNVDFLHQIQDIHSSIGALNSFFSYVDEVDATKENFVTKINEILTERDAAITAKDKAVTDYLKVMAERDTELVKCSKACERVQQLENRLVDLQHQNKNLSDYVESLLSSKSWRWTKPLRTIYDAVDWISWRLHDVRDAYQKGGIDYVLKKTSDYIRELIGYKKIASTSIQEFKQENSINRFRQYSILCLPIIEWEFRFQRPQQLACCFADHGHKVFFISNQFGEKFDKSLIRNGIIKIKLPGNPSQNVYKDSISNNNAEHIATILSAYLATEQVTHLICLVQLPFWSPVAENLRKQLNCYIVYDCMDDHAGFITNSSKMLELEEHLLDEADLVVASSQLLLNKTISRKDRSILIRNGVDYSHFSTVPSIQHQPLDKLIVGYYGAIADWFDSELVGELSLIRPNWKFILIGSTFNANMSPLAKQSNIEFKGEQPYAALTTLIKSWDCCIIPFKRLPLTEATNPVKIYEMLAAGKPVVAVALPELIAISDNRLIALADTAQSFADAIELEVLHDCTDRQNERRNFAKKNTWIIRYIELDQEIRQLFPLVSIIVVTFNNFSLTRLCLESVFKDTDYPNIEVIVVDNASSDETPSYLRELETQEPRLKIILNNENRGFSAANNQGIAVAKGQYLCLLNNDTVVSGAWVSILTGHLRANPRLGLVGPVTNAISNEAQIPVGYQNLADMPQWAEEWSRTHRGQLTNISMLAFFCVVMPRQVTDIVGLLDERFGTGMFEDDDYNRRVRVAEYEIKLARDCFVHHWQKSSFNLLGEEEYLRIYYENQGKYRAKWSDNFVSKPSSLEKLATLKEKSSSAPATVIFAPSVGWKIHLFQRPHHLARALVHEGYTVVFDCSNSHDDVDVIQEIEKNLFLFKAEPELLSELPRVVLWTFTYNYNYRDYFPPETRVIYDWIDDLSVFPYDQNFLARLHRRALGEANIVASVARRLHEQASTIRSDAIYLPNAVEQGRFETLPHPNPARNDPDLAGCFRSGKPIAGYYGALAEWFDYDLLLKTAKLRPDWNFVLIGPDYDQSIGRSRITRQANVYWIGPRPYSDLPGYLHLFNVAIIPFKINDITLATSPLKLYEYFAGGKLVITTPMPECMAFPEVQIISTAEEFAAKLDVAPILMENSEFRNHLSELASENTWIARVQLVINQFDKILPV